LQPLIKALNYLAFVSSGFNIVQQFYRPDKEYLCIKKYLDPGSSGSNQFPPFVKIHALVNKTVVGFRDDLSFAL
jgi:hypothetical protein